MKKEKNTKASAEKTNEKTKASAKKEKAPVKEIKSPIKKRILEYLSFRQLSQYECYAKTGMSRSILTQPSGISEENLKKFLSCYPEVNPEWLILGTGEMLMKPTNNSITFPHLRAVAEDGAVYENQPCVYYQVCKDVENLNGKINILEEDIKLLKEELKNKISD